MSYYDNIEIKNEILLKKLNKAFGLGDVNKAKIWFIAPKVQDEFKSLDEIREMEIITTLQFDDELGIPVFITCETMAKIIAGLKFGSENIPDNWEEILKFQFKEDDEVFFSDFYNIGFSDRKPFPEQYKEWFGFVNEKHYLEYFYKNMLQKRFDLFNRFRSEKNILLICFGKELQHLYIHFFDLRDSVFDGYGDNIRYYYEANILLASFDFFRGIDSEIKKIVEIINMRNANPFKNKLDI